MHPIEMKAHDPVNYVGDMLAFLFRAMSVECDIARGLIDERTDAEDGVGGGDDETTTADVFNDEDTLATMAVKPMTSIEILLQAMSGVTRPLKSRVSQVFVTRRVLHLSLRFKMPKNNPQRLFCKIIYCCLPLHLVYCYINFSLQI